MCSEISARGVNGVALGFKVFVIEFDKDDSANVKRAVLFFAVVWAQ